MTSNESLANSLVCEGIVALGTTSTHHKSMRNGVFAWIAPPRELGRSCVRACSIARARSLCFKSLARAYHALLEQAPAWRTST